MIDDKVNDLLKANDEELVGDATTETTSTTNDPNDAGSTGVDSVGGEVGGAEEAKAEAGEEKAVEKPKKKISNRAFKKLEWQNKNLMQRLEEIEGRLQSKDAPKKLSRADYQSDDEWINNAIIERLAEIEERGRIAQEAEEQRQALSSEWEKKVEATVGDKAGFFERVQQMGNLDELLGEEVCEAIYHDPKGPVILDYLSKRSKAVEAIRKANSVMLPRVFAEIVDEANRLYKQQSNKSAQKTDQKLAPKNPPKPIGSLGDGKMPTSNNPEEMSDRELMAWARGIK